MKKRSAPSRGNKQSSAPSKNRGAASKRGASQKSSAPQRSSDSSRGDNRSGNSHRSSEMGRRGQVLGSQKVNDAKDLQKKFPRIVAGHHAVAEAIKYSDSSESVLWLTKAWESSKDLRDLETDAKDKKIKIEIKPDEQLKAISPSNQGSLLFTNRIPEWDILNSYIQQDQTLLILDGVEDPHNLGAVLRTSWLLGVAAVIIPQDRAVSLTPTVHKVACGGAEHVPVVVVSNLAQFIEEAKKYEFWVFGLSHKASREIQQLKIPERVIWILGSEDSGMRITTERVCDELVKLPQIAKDASYNVSNAAAMALFETARQKTSE